VIGQFMSMIVWSVYVDEQLDDYQFMSVIGQFMSMIGQFMSVIGQFMSTIGQFMPVIGRFINAVLSN